MPSLLLPRLTQHLGLRQGPSRQTSVKPPLPLLALRLELVPRLPGPIQRRARGPCRQRVEQQLHGPPQERKLYLAVQQESLLPSQTLQGYPQALWRRPEPHGRLHSLHRHRAGMPKCIQKLPGLNDNERISRIITSFHCPSIFTAPCAADSHPPHVTIRNLDRRKSARCSLERITETVEGPLPRSRAGVHQMPSPRIDVAL
jgi:hypothetical protein